MRKTVDRSTIVEIANRQIAHLSKSGTKSDADKRAAIVAAVSAILIEADSYRGFRYLVQPPQGAESLRYLEGTYYLPSGEVWTWDYSRIAFLH
jgi:hypothetical protein